jgi:hypothetical protein
MEPAPEPEKDTDPGAPPLRTRDEMDVRLYSSPVSDELRKAVLDEFNNMPILKGTDVHVAKIPSWQTEDE